MLKVGRRAQEFQLPDVNGKPVSLASLQERGPVLLAFFKVSCPVCQYTLPFLERIAAGGQLSVVGISQNDAEATRDFCRTFGLTFPMLLDSSSDGYRVSNAFAISVVPSLFIVETDNRISLATSGFSRGDLQDIGRLFHMSVFHDGEETPAFKPG